jgi:imidazolonepropionase-like amidohydrolase
MRILGLRSGVCAGIVFASIMCISIAEAQSPPVLIRADKVYTVTNGTLEPGEILLCGGKICAVGSRVSAPPDAILHEARVVIPGMIDPHSHIGLRQTSPSTSPDDPPITMEPVTAELKTVDYLNLEDPIFQEVLSEGVTSTIVRHGSGRVSTGQAVALKLRGNSKPPMILKPYVDLKMAVRLRNRSPGSHPDNPETVMGWAAVFDDYFRRASDYVQAWEEYESGRRTAKPDEDARLEAFAAVLRGEVLLYVHVTYVSDVNMLVYLARKYNVLDQLVLGHPSWAFMLGDILAEANVMVNMGPELMTRFEGDVRTHNTVKPLMDAGVVVSLQSDAGGGRRMLAKHLREQAATLIPRGLSEQQALEAITINAAKAMMMSDRLGSIEVGKDADIVLMDGPPFDLHTPRVQKVFVDGVLEYERKEPASHESLTTVGPFTPMVGMIAQEVDAFAITNAHLFTVSQGNLRGGTMVVRDGKIAEILDNNHDIPDGLPQLDVGGRVIVPGWVNPRAYPTMWMLPNNNDEDKEPIVPEMRARFSVDPWYPSFADLREMGVTSQNITPGHANLIGGSGAFHKMAGMDVGKMTRKDPSSLVFSLVPASVRRWVSQGAEAAPLEQALVLIRATLDRAVAYEMDDSVDKFDAQLAAMGPVVRGEVPVIIKANSVDEIRAAIELAEEYRFRLIVSGAVEAHRMVDELARINAGVILGTGGRVETIRGEDPLHSDMTPILLTRAGVRVSFLGAPGSDKVMPSGALGGEPALNAAWVFRNGATEEEALRMVTLGAAEMIGVSDLVGSLDVGKDADFMVLEGHPFDYRVLPQMVFIDGKLVVDSR